MGDKRPPREAMTSEERRKYHQEYTAKNRERIYARAKAWRTRNAERFKEYQRLYREKHKEKIMDWDRKWRFNNPEKIKQIKRLWRKNSRDLFLAGEARRLEYKRDWARQSRRTLSDLYVAQTISKEIGVSRSFVRKELTTLVVAKREFIQAKRLLKEI
jgi:hypothetical protein